MEQEEKTPQEIVVDVQKKLDELLKANNCALEVEARRSYALGKQVMVLETVIVYKGEKKKY
jgi:hypothetical protein